MPASAPATPVVPVVAPVDAAAVLRQIQDQARGR
jgi:hypothetical protein